jgi:hypothetical protein
MLDGLVSTHLFCQHWTSQKGGGGSFSPDFTDRFQMPVWLLSFTGSILELELEGGGNEEKVCRVRTFVDETHSL